MLQLVRGLAWPMPGHDGVNLGYTHQIRALFCTGVVVRASASEQHRRLGWENTGSDSTSLCKTCSRSGGSWGNWVPRWAETKY